MKTFTKNEARMHRAVNRVFYLVLKKYGTTKLTEEVNKEIKEKLLRICLHAEKLKWVILPYKDMTFKSAKVLE